MHHRRQFFHCVISPCGLRQVNNLHMILHRLQMLAYKYETIWKIKLSYIFKV